MTAHSRPKQVVVTGAFDDLRSGQIRFLEEAARLGEVTALLWADDLVRQFEGNGPKFPQAERAYCAAGGAGGEGRRQNEEGRMGDEPGRGGGAEGWG